MTHHMNGMNQMWKGGSEQDQETEGGAWFKLLAERGHGGEDRRGWRRELMFGTMVMGEKGSYQAQLQASLNE